jgi:hypothetical protein
MSEYPRSGQRLRHHLGDPAHVRHSGVEARGLRNRAMNKRIWLTILAVAVAGPAVAPRGSTDPECTDQRTCNPAPGLRYRPGYG